MTTIVNRRAIVRPIVNTMKVALYNKIVIIHSPLLLSFHDE
jgi:hypothetical protein